MGEVSTTLKEIRCDSELALGMAKVGKKIAGEADQL